NSLQLAGLGTFTLTEANAVGTLAGQTTGNLSYTDSDALTIGTVNGKPGLDTVSNNATITTGGLLTIGAGAGEDISANASTVDINAAGISEGVGSIITASKLRFQGTGTFTLTQANNVATLAANTTGTVKYTDADSLTVGTVAGTAGINSGGSLVALIA